MIFVRFPNSRWICGVLNSYTDAMIGMKALPKLILALTTASLCYGAAPSLTVSVAPIDESGRTVYSGTIRNPSSAMLELQTVEMPGGYVGSGRFFNCSVERMDTRTGTWKGVLGSALSQFKNPKIGSVMLGRGDAIEVCRELLPRGPATKNSCVRFRVSAGWGPASKAYFSAPFLAGKGTKVQGCQGK